ncbi:MAG: hypothetical protein AAB649_01665 [Patescibacteria group bacterium]
MEKIQMDFDVPKTARDLTTKIEEMRTHGEQDTIGEVIEMYIKMAFQSGRHEALMSIASKII